MTYAGAIEALADPTRRQVFEKLSRGPSSVAELAKGLPVSRPAVSQHLRILREAGLVSDHPKGTRRIYRVEPEGLNELRLYLESFWRDAMDNYASHVRKKGREG